MTESEFINLVRSELTASGRLPDVVPPEEIKRILDREKNFFFANSVDATQEEHYIIKKEVFQYAEFTKTRELILPDCVEAITEVREMNQWGRLGTIDRDLSETRLIASEMFLSSFTGDDLVLRVAQAAYFDLTKSFFLTFITFEYNKNTHKLKILGRTPYYDIYLKTWSKIPMDRLFTDYLFQDWIIAKCKISFARIVGTYQLPLVGNTTINFDAIKTEGQERIKEIEETLRGLDPPNWIGIFH